jgi:hypothetical protein
MVNDISRQAQEQEQRQEPGAGAGGRIIGHLSFDISHLSF